jgi:predicted DNA-binding protein YlxM (UPF0122 family)
MKETKPPLTLPVIMKLKARGNGIREIANLYGVSFQAVSQRIKRDLPDSEHRCPQCLRKHEK